MCRPIRLCLLGALLLQGCTEITQVIPERFVTPDNPFCRALYQHHDWLDAAVITESHWGLPLHIALAELNLSIGTEATEYINPTSSDWEEYRLATENWAGQFSDIETSLDFLGWHAQTARHRNNLTMDQAGQLYIASRIGHGGLYRKEYKSDLLLLRQAEKIDIRALQYREDLKACPRIRERAGSFFRLPF